LAIAAGRFDAVIVHGYANLSTLVALTQPRARATRVLLRSETTLLHPRPAAKRAAKQVLLRALFRRIDHFLAIGACSRAYFEAYGAPGDRITIAPYTVDNDYFDRRSAAARRDPQAARRKLGLPTDATMFLFCSKIAPHKRPLDVLRAFARARARPRTRRPPSRTSAMGHRCPSSAPRSRVSGSHTTYTSSGFAIRASCPRFTAPATSSCKRPSANPGVWS
jgi:hypothetical protein